MSFLLRNLQRSVKINTVLFEYHVNLIRKIMRVNSYDMAVICFEDDKVQNLNREYRGIDEPTDVLAFPFLDVSQRFIICLKQYKRSGIVVFSGSSSKFHSF